MNEINVDVVQMRSKQSINCFFLISLKETWVLLIASAATQSTKKNRSSLSSWAKPNESNKKGKRTDEKNTTQQICYQRIQSRSKKKKAKSILGLGIEEVAPVCKTKEEMN